jgi:hypothetical protein
MILGIYKKNNSKDKNWLLMSYAWDLKSAEAYCSQLKTKSKQIGLNDVQSVIQSFGSIEQVPATIENPKPEKELYN